MLAQFNKTPGERKRYTIDYSQWLGAGEQISAVTFQVTLTAGSPGAAPALFVDGYSLTSLTSLIMYVAAGADNCDYDLVITATTTQNQIKQDLVVYNVRSAT